MPLYSNPTETSIKYFVPNSGKHTTQHQGRASIREKSLRLALIRLLELNFSKIRHCACQSVASSRSVKSDHLSREVLP